MKTLHVAIIGFGSIGRDLVDILSQPHESAPCRISLLVRAEKVDQTRRALEGRNVRVFSDLDDMIKANPDVIAECAGHGAVSTYGLPILQKGIDLVVSSIGALADEATLTCLQNAARESGAQLVVPAGAIGGIDALGAARLSGLHSVAYTGRKPPSAWLGTPAENVADLATLRDECVFFEGTARQAAISYPKNANVAATLALAGLGMDKTKVRLIADPNASENIHEFSVSSKALDFSMRLVGKPSPLNAKTSRSTVYSIARAILNLNSAIVI